MKILVAMSGGVDSSVAAALLVERGHHVVGATLKLWGGPADSGCCSVGDVDDARRVAQILGVDHHVFNYTEEFERHVVEPFVSGHLAGQSPNPCIECNRHLKFDLLFERARRLGFERVATGHHAQVLVREGVPRLVRGADAAKDQSYVLGYLRREQLERLELPIGHLTKDEVRLEARRVGLRTWDKPDSQDVCFIQAATGRHHFFAERAALTSADIVDAASGDVLGHTDAAELMTVGQRRGVASGRDGERRFVQRVDLRARRVEVARLDDVMITSLTLDAASLSFSDAALASGTAVLVQCSAHGRSQGATLRRDDEWRLDFDAPTRPVAPGQSVVMYHVEQPSEVAGAALVRP